MHDYPDIQHYLTVHVEQAAERYVEAQHQTGLDPNDTLTRAIAERTVREAQASYIQEATEIRDTNIGIMLERHHRRMDTIKREGAKLRLLTCPPIALLFGLFA